MEGKVKSGLAIFLTWRANLSLSFGPIAKVGCVPVRNLSMGPISSTRIIQACTQ